VRLPTPLPPPPPLVTRARGTSGSNRDCTMSVNTRHMLATCALSLEPCESCEVRCDRLPCNASRMPVTCAWMVSSFGLSTVAISVSQVSLRIVSRDRSKPSCCNNDNRITWLRAWRWMRKNPRGSNLLHSQVIKFRSDSPKACSTRKKFVFS